MTRWTKGHSGNPRGRPKAGAAIAELARRQLDKRKLIERLGRIAAGEREFAEVGVDYQLRAIQLLLAYFWPAKGRNWEHGRSKNQCCL